MFTAGHVDDFLLDVARPNSSSEDESGSPVHVAASSLTLGGRVPTPRERAPGLLRRLTELWRVRGSACSVLCLSNRELQEMRYLTKLFFGPQHCLGLGAEPFHSNPIFSTGSV